MNIFITSFFIYLSTYFVSYFIWNLLKVTYEKIDKESYEDIKQNVWIKLYCIITVLCIHYVWVFCNKHNKKGCGSHPYYLFPILFLIPIYMIFVLDYIEYRWVKLDKENEKLNRIFTNIMILLFVLNVLFFFLSKELKTKTMRYLEIFFLLELF